ncbi:MAG: GTPase ObgE [Capsulimonadaceae bacterium]|nr:GTPase ObgE [Capsulimonadaceae bacterium]
MIFVDEVTVDVKAGDGGNGAVSFRKEKFVPRGGPSGGDGGRGGDVILEGDSNLSTLLDFKYQRKYGAKRGGDGATKDMIGRDALDLVLKVPIGTIATDVETGRVLADITKHAQRIVIAHGGRGGRGNAHFATSTHQAPKYAENGEPSLEIRVKLELKLLADVGLIGFPNVGKSSLIASVSAARPKIADYPFTTLIPNLGVVRVDNDPENTFVMADIPGIIEGASEGAGLGHQFLRHVERTRVLVHILDVSEANPRNWREDYEILIRELAAYSKLLAALPQVVALNKIDIADEDIVAEAKEHLESLGLTVFPISAATGGGTHPLLYHLVNMLRQIPRAPLEQDDDDDVMRITVETHGTIRRDRSLRRQFTVERDEETGDFIVRGPGIERLVSMTQLDNEHALTRLQRIMEKSGIIRKLRETGAVEGSTVRIGVFEFDFIDEDADE